MPEYIYRAVTDKGQIVKNKVEDSSRQSLIRKLKVNGLMPIQIVQTGYGVGKRKKAKRNIDDMQGLLNSVNTTAILNSRKKSPSLVENFKLKLSSTEKVTNRDLVIFTQNFYLLKKANFNNIHALNTIIQSTENITLVGVLEDVLAGVEDRRIYVYNYGILFKYISDNIY